jgi:predicted permease
VACAEIAAALRDAPLVHLAYWRRRAAHAPSPPPASGWGSDLRLARRQVTGAPLRSALVVTTFALAIGASTAIFSGADAVLLRPLPFPASDRLVRLYEETKDASREGISLPAFEVWQRELRAVRALAFFEPRTALVMIDGEPEQLSGATVSRSFFEVLAAAPQHGAPFSPGPLTRGPREVVIAHRLWQRLGGSEAVVGSMLGVDPGTFAIVGVMPPDFDYPAGAQFWTAAGDLGILHTERSLRFLSAIGRLTPDADLAALQAELAVLTDRHPATDRLGGDVRMTARTLRDSIVGSVRTGITSALAAVALLVIVACCNISGLLLAESSTRARQRAVQAALGASRGRIARQQAFEVLWLAAPGCLLGVWAAWLCRDAIVALSREEIPLIAGTALDVRVMVFAVVATVVTALAASLAPSWSAARTSTRELSSRGSGHTRGVFVVLRGLVVAEVALTFVVAVSGVLRR